MARVVSLLRGINVGGARPINMPALRELYTRLGFERVESYVQSGNVVCDTDETDVHEVAARIEEGIAETFGHVDVDVIVRSADAMARIVAANPYPEAAAEPTTLHVVFLADDVDAGAYDHLVDEQSPEQFSIGSDRVIYLLLPDGIGRSKLAANLSRVRGPAATVRNWRTTVKLLDMVSG